MVLLSEMVYTSSGTTDLYTRFKPIVSSAKKLKVNSSEGWVNVRMLNVRFGVVADLQLFILKGSLLWFQFFQFCTVALHLFP